MQSNIQRGRIRKENSDNINPLNDERKEEHLIMGIKGGWHKREIHGVHIPVYGVYIDVNIS